MVQGTVDKYSEDKGFGYILRDDGKLIYVERDSINMIGYKTLIPGDRVTFDIEKGIDGPEAKKVTRIRHNE
ncbi:MAG: cold shock domain-containing protein [Thermodesulfobacteriota bacterium]|nr:cold shock domain-containing protein [Thermodesulfobacteriota bacterium]